MTTNKKQDKSTKIIYKVYDFLYDLILTTKDYKLAYWEALNCEGYILDQQGNLIQDFSYLDF